jgi:hypothetical protein
MSDEKKKTDDTTAPLQHENHTLRSRRDFLAQGLISGVGYTMLPGLLSMFKMNTAEALECGFGNQQVITRTPIIIFDLSGGANIPGSNVMVGKAGGQLDFISDYKTLGLPMDMHPKNSNQLNTELGLAFHNDSGLLRGIQSVSQMSTRSKVEGGVFCSASNDDTQNNPHNPMYWLAKAGANGKLASLAGTVNSESGGRSMAPQSSVVTTLRPVTINSAQDALGLVNIGRLGSIYGSAKAQKVLKTIENLSAQKLKQFDSKALPDQIKDLISCGYIQSQDLLSRFTTDMVDPTLDPLVVKAFPDMANNGEQRKTAAIAKLVFDGFIGVGTVEKGGFDYHDNSRSTGETRDFEAGIMIGRVLELAALKQQNVMIYVFTDGGVSASAITDDSTTGRGKLRWTGDNSQRSSSFMLVYRHAAKATLRTANKRQIGMFKENGAVDTTNTLVSNSVTNLSKAVVANYLSLSGQESKLASVVGDNPFGSNLNNYLFFNKVS